MSVFAYNQGCNDTSVHRDRGCLDSAIVIVFSTNDNYR